jgi:hypothetical protein
MTAIINGSSPTVTFSDGTTQATSAIVSGYVPYANLPAGSVLQVVSTSSAVQSTANSTSFVTTSITATIVPKFATSKILVTVSGGGMDNWSSPDKRMGLTVYKNGSTQIGTFTNAYAQASRVIVPASYQYLDSPATTSSTTYTIYIKAFGSYDVYLNSQGETITITAMEIAA